MRKNNKFLYWGNHQFYDRGSTFVCYLPITNIFRRKTRGNTKQDWAKTQNWIRLKTSKVAEGNHLVRGIQQNHEKDRAKNYEL
jgi:hypothetical protein